MKFKVGDKVRVRKDLEAGKRYYMADTLKYAATIPSMVKHRGEIATIYAINSHGFYVIDGSPSSWTDEMFEAAVVSANDATNKDAKLSACAELEADLLTSLIWDGSAVKCGDTAKKLYALGYRKHGDDIIEVKCKNCEFYNTEKARCGHPQLDWDDSVSAVWLDMGPDDFCSHGSLKKPEDKLANYSGKIVCIECKSDAFVPGKMYDCTDGCLNGEDNELWGFVRKPNNDKYSIFCLLGSETDPFAKFIAVSN